MKTTVPSVFIAFAFLCFAFVQNTQSVSPAPDGGYPVGNTAEGQSALLSLTTGGYNTAVGFLSVGSDTIGSFNTGIGAGTLLANTADQNTATGAGALLSNTTGPFNTGNGAFALFFNTGGESNSAFGWAALESNTTGDHNTTAAVGALIGNTTVVENTATGYHALISNTLGDFNTGVGTAALASNGAGMRNTAIGLGALSGNVAGSYNIAVGDTAGISITGDDNIAIGNEGNAGESETIRIGHLQTKTLIAGIHGVTTGINNAIPVLIDSAGQLGTTSSSRRFKNEIKPMDKASDAILGLNPVTFHYKSDKKNTPQFGLIAEEVAAVNPDLVVRDENGEIYTVRYDAVNAMLLNEFLKEHGKVEQLTEDFQSKLAQQQKQIEALTAGLQKVTAQFEAGKAAPQVAENN